MMGVPGGQADGVKDGHIGSFRVMFGSEFVLDWFIIKFPCKFFIYKVLALPLSQ